MKIAIEAQRLFREKKHGMDFVALELIKNLMEIDKKNEYFIFVSPDKDKCIQSTNNFTIIELDGGAYPIWEQFALPKAIKKYGCEILQCTSNTAPINISIPLIVILHDIIYMESIAIFKNGYSFYQKIGNMYRRFIVPKILNKATKIITVSNFERNRIKDFFNFPDEKIIAIYNGVGSHFNVITDNNYLSEIRQKYLLPEKYFFFLGNTDPKKNTKNVLQAYSNYTKQKGNSTKLLMLDFDEIELNKLLVEINDKPLRQNIYLAGYVANTDLPAIYNMAELFLYPSLRESFGIPILEAMACGIPVITSNTSSMPEIAENAAKIINPFNHSEITNAMIEISENESIKKDFVTKGFEQVKHFSWKQMAQQNLNLYIDVLDNFTLEEKYQTSMLFI
jgi:glycosyltransferase involved in cell wall biosynthesis